MPWYVTHKTNQTMQRQLHKGSVESIEGTESKDSNRTHNHERTTGKKDLLGKGWAVGEG